MTSKNKVYRLVIKCSFRPNNLLHAITSIITSNQKKRNVQVQKCYKYTLGRVAAVELNVPCAMLQRELEKQLGANP